MLNIESKLENGVLNVALEGEMNTNTAPTVKKELDPLLKDATEVIFDFSKLDYISSAGLRVLLEIEQFMEDKGSKQVRIINISDVIRHVFDITGFSHVLSLE